MKNKDKVVLNLSTRAVMAIFVFAAVGLNVLSAIALKMLSDQSNISLILLILGIAAVFLLNALRMLVWYFANRRYPLSTMYPLTSLFYPIMLIVSYLYGETINFPQIVGTFFITLGVFWLGWRVDANEKTAS